VTAGLLEGADVVEWVRFLREEEGAKAGIRLVIPWTSSLLPWPGAGRRSATGCGRLHRANMPTRYQLLRNASGYR